MRLRFILPVLVASLCASLAARADTMTTFTLTHGTDVFQFSISDTTPVTHYTHQFPGNNETFEYQVPLSVNGTVLLPGAPLFVDEGFENKQQPANTGAEFFLEWQTGVVNGYPQYMDYFEHGPQIYANINGNAVFKPGTFTFDDVDILQGRETTRVNVRDTLVVTQTEAINAPVPEPSSLLLLGTGVVGAMRLVRHRLL